MFNTKFPVYKSSTKLRSVGELLLGIVLNVCGSTLTVLLRCTPWLLILAAIVLIVKTVWKS